MPNVLGVNRFPMGRLWMTHGTVIGSLSGLDRRQEIASLYKTGLSLPILTLEKFNSSQSLSLREIAIA